ncbi:MAG: hypothetical protein KDD82_02315, partial [Planctomycetes bacterium]|nr:hypothetical protein [Planctomycetota bacterium]
MHTSSSLSLGVLAALCLLTPSPAQDVVRVVSDSEVRVGPGTFLAPLGRAAAGDRYVTAGRSGTWTAVHFAGRRGWIESSRLRASSGTRLEVSARSLNVRSGPSSRYRKVGAVVRGEVYVQVGSLGAWRQIVFGGARRWAFGSYLHPLPETGAPAPIPAAPPAAPPPQGGSLPKSLMVQASTLTSTPPAELRRWLEHVKREHRDRSRSDFVANLVLQDIADERGDLITAVLDVCEDYFDVFDNVFVGTQFIPWTGPGSRYVEGIVDAGFRWKNLRTSRKAMDAFLARYPQLTFHWYIGYEANLSDLADPTTRAAYEAYLIQAVQDMHARRPRTAVLWSPTFWRGFRSSAVLQRNLSALFRNVQAADPDGIGINWLHWQDSVGKRLLTATDVARWHTFLGSVHRFDSLKVNMEFFRPDGRGGIVPGDPAEHARREDAYRRLGVPLGASWEI